MITAFLMSLAIAQATPPANAAKPPKASCARKARLARPSQFDNIPADADPGDAFRDVRLIIFIDERGKVTGGSVLVPSGAPKLDRAILADALASAYVPEIKNCHPVKAGYLYIVQYGTPPKKV